jgi:uncharacterized membrane protein YfcA
MSDTTFEICLGYGIGIFIGCILAPRTPAGWIGVVVNFVAFVIFQMVMQTRREKRKREES